MSHSTMTEPEVAQAFVYNKKTYTSKKEALGAEVNDRIVEILKSNNSRGDGGYGGYGSDYWRYVNADFVANLDEISEVMDYYKEHTKESNPAPTHTASSDGWAW